MPTLLEDYFSSYRVITGIGSGQGNECQMVEKRIFSLALKEVQKVLEFALEHQLDPDRHFGKFPPEFVVFEAVLREPPQVYSSDTCITVTTGYSSRILPLREEHCHDWDGDCLVIEDRTIECHYLPGEGTIQCSTFYLANLQGIVDLEPEIRKDLLRCLDELTANCRNPVIA